MTKDLVKAISNQLGKGKQTTDPKTSLQLVKHYSKKANQMQ